MTPPTDRVVGVGFSAGRTPTLRNISLGWVRGGDVGAGVVRGSKMKNRKFVLAWVAFPLSPLSPRPAVSFACLSLCPLLWRLLLCHNPSVGETSSSDSQSAAYVIIKSGRVVKPAAAGGVGGQGEWREGGVGIWGWGWGRGIEGRGRSEDEGQGLWASDSDSGEEEGVQGESSRDLARELLREFLDADVSIHNARTSARTHK